MIIVPRFKGYLTTQVLLLYGVRVQIVIGREHGVRGQCTTRGQKAPLDSQRQPEGPPRELEGHPVDSQRGPPWTARRSPKI